MVGCSGINCNNRSEKGFRLFKFPSDPKRREKWVINCRRDKFNPKKEDNYKLCEVRTLYTKQ